MHAVPWLLAVVITCNTSVISFITRQHSKYRPGLGVKAIFKYEREQIETAPPKKRRIISRSSDSRSPPPAPDRDVEKKKPSAKREVGNAVVSSRQGDRSRSGSSTGTTSGSKNEDRRRPGARRNPKKVSDSIEGLSFSNTVSIGSERSPLESFACSDAMRRALAAQGFTSLTPVQSQAFEPIRAGKDIVARSKTGTGKTYAFGIPLVERIAGKLTTGTSTAGPLVLILEPTRELVVQVAQELGLLCKGNSVRVTAIYGGVPYEPQVKALERGTHVLVGTPGRILDHINRGSLNIGAVQHIVLDEGDRMLEMGFQKHVETILANVKRPGAASRLAAQRALEDDDEDAESEDGGEAAATRRVQTLLFSATMAGWICKLTARHMRSPVFLDDGGVTDSARLPATIQHLVMAPPREKSRLKQVVSALQDLVLGLGRNTQVIVFCNTKREADSIAEAPALAFLQPRTLHGDMTQGARGAVIRDFKLGKFHVLVATDVAARGLDIDNVGLVVQTQLPNDLDSFVHRAGRTGRAGRAGASVMICSDDKERARLGEFERALHIVCEPAYISTMSQIDAAKNIYSFKLPAKAVVNTTEKGLISKTPASLPMDKVDELDAVQHMFEEGAWLGTDAPSEELLKENQRLRALLAAEMEGTPSTLTPEERARAQLLLDRSLRKKDKRALYYQKRRDEKAAAAAQEEE
jgi:ATP-dependent RNA helicase DDX21